MIYIILSVLCSVTVGVLLKLARRYQISNQQAIGFNYLFAIGLSYFFFDPVNVPATAIPWPVYLALGVLLPLIFWVLSVSVRDHGIVKTDIAQRLSLFISLVAAWLLFKEQISDVKLVGLMVGLTAIFLILNKNINSPGQDTSAAKAPAEKAAVLSWLYPILVFTGFGAIDILFKQVAKFTVIPYTTSLFYIFIISFVISMLFLAYQFITKRERFQLVNFFCGAILGLFNFGNILFYLKAHRLFADSPSTVFAAMNLGVIVVGSVVGILLFREKLSKLNIAGIFLAIIAVIIIAYAQANAI